MAAPIESPICEIITIGSELLLGQIIDTNTTFLAKALNKIGVAIHFRTAVGDDLEEIVSVIRNAAERSDVIITTGGLGPTMDDLTREAVSVSAGTELEFREDLMEQIEGIFRRAGYQMSENNRRQAFVPAGSEPIPNPVGTAPGFISAVNGKPVICLPGVPRELNYLFHHVVIPWLRKRFQIKDRIITYKVLKTAGIGESKVDLLIGDLITAHQNPQVGLLASIGEVRIRITAIAESEAEAMTLIHPVEQDIRSRLGNNIFGEGEDTLEGVIHSLLSKRALTLAVLETFSGGLMTHRLCMGPNQALISGMVIPKEERVAPWLGQNHPEWGMEGARSLACKIRDMTRADVGLALVGFPVNTDTTNCFLKAYAYVVGENIRKHFSWESAGEPPTLQQRGIVIGLNTLRLALLESDNERNTGKEEA